MKKCAVQWGRSAAGAGTVGARGPTGRATTRRRGLELGGTVPVRTGVHANTINFTSRLDFNPSIGDERGAMVLLVAV